MMRNVRVFVLLALCASLALGSIASGRDYVNSENDLRVHIILHAERVKLLGLALFRMFPHEFPDVRRDELARFLVHHDWAKQKLLGQLYALYGHQIEPGQTGSEVIVEINRRDRELATGFFRAQDLLEKDGSLKPGALQYLRIERIADGLDRAKSPVSKEEFGRILESAPEWFEKTGHKDDVPLASALEERYPSIVAGATYECAAKALRISLRLE